MGKSPLISKIRCHNPNKHSSRIRNRNYLVYIGTREGVDLTDFDFKKSIEEATRECYDEIEDASSQHDTSPNRIYLQYIAERPGSHGLFGNIDVSDINAVGNHVADLTKQGQNIYRGIVSLSEQDALELGYCDKEKWAQYMRSVMPDVAAEFGIPVDKLQWTAAVHMEKGHPHCHYMFWRTDDKVQSSFIHTSVQNRCRELLSKEMFSQEREQIVINKTLSRDYLIESGNEIMDEAYQVLKTHNYEKLPNRFTYNDINHVAGCLASLSNVLPVKGSIKYQYQTDDIKKATQAVVNEILEIPYFQRAYAKYMADTEKTSDTYSAGANKKGRTLSHAESDIRKRLCNAVLKHSKEIKINREILEGFDDSFSLPDIEALSEAGSSYMPVSALNQKKSFEQYSLGKIYADKNSSLYDPEKAIHYFEKADEHKHFYAKYALARIYADKNSSLYNITKAVTLLKQSATDRNSYAHLKLGSIYIWGNHKEIPKNKALGMEHLQMAVEAGNPYAAETIKAYTAYEEALHFSWTYNLFRNVFSSLTKKQEFDLLFTETAAQKQSRERQKAHLQKARGISQEDKERESS